MLNRLLGVLGIFWILSAIASADNLFDGQIAQTHWAFSLGVGWSIPLNGKGFIPATRNTLVLSNQFGGDFRSTSIEKEVPISQATVYEGSVFYALTPWLSGGVFGGTSSQYYGNASPADVHLDVKFYGYDGTRVDTHEDGFGVIYEMHVSRAVPFIRIGPWLGHGNYRLRPYVTTGAGWYMVDQYVEYHLTPNQWDWRFFSKSDQYLGAMGGAGITIGLPDNGSISLEGRYERIFSPTQKIQFFTPTLEFGYHFGS